MTDQAPTVVAVEMRSAWLIMLSVSVVTFAAITVVFRSIQRPSRVASALALMLPLLLPLAVCAWYGRGALPGVVVLKPAVPTLLADSADLLHVLFVPQGPRGAVVPYVFSAPGTSYVLLCALALCSLIVLRRLLGHLLVSRLLSRCRLPRTARERRLVDATERFARAAGLRRIPRLLIAPPGEKGALATGFVRGSIVVAEDVLEVLTDEELEAVVAHEVAHLAGRDLPLLVAAAALRDLTFWNPVSHLAFRRVVRQRELEADESAAELTGKPLAVASSILRLRSSLAPRCARRLGPVPGFGDERVSAAQRVERLIALSDGDARGRRASGVVQLAAVGLVVALGLQVGAGVARSRAAPSLLWNLPSGRPPDVWLPKRGSHDPQSRARRLEGPRRADRRPQAKSNPNYFKQLLERNVAVRERDFPKLLDALSALARRRGRAPLDRPRLSGENWEAVPLFTGAPSAPVGLYHVREQAAP